MGQTFLSFYLVFPSASWEGETILLSLEANYSIFSLKSMMVKEIIEKSKVVKSILHGSKSSTFSSFPFSKKNHVYKRREGH